MQYNSLIFAILFTVVFVGYWAIGTERRALQNAWLLLANCIFYAWWDVRFLALIFAAALVDYAVGLKLEKAEALSSRRWLLGISLVVNLGALGFFKYYNFFAQSAADLLHTLGMQADLPTLRLILPLGISFYTFSRLSYALDLYRKQIPACKDLLSFLVFSSFFPLIVAGPIERAKRLLPQLEKSRSFDIDRAKDGLRQILWGLFRKIVIADTLAVRVDDIFANYSATAGIDLTIGIFLYAIQIYVDFAAYSDIAMGVGKLLGFRIMRNFAYPYFSRDIAEFWRRWHISMSSWFRDYVYTPLSMKVSLASPWKRVRNILITFGVSGLWHGANWTFIVWGLIHGCLFIPLILGKPPERDTAMVAEEKFLPSLREAWEVLSTFVLVTLAWVFFRSNSLGAAFDYFRSMFSNTWAVAPHDGLLVLMCAALLLAEWLRRDKVHLLEVSGIPKAGRWAIYFGVILGILVFGEFNSHGFYYAQF